MAPLSHVQEPLELLALTGGVVAPLMLSNVSYRTRDALLLYNSLRLTLDLASLRRVPTGSAKILYKLVQSWGIDSALLQGIASAPQLYLSEINGQWSFEISKGKHATVASLCSVSSDLDHSSFRVLCLGALFGRLNLVTSCLGVTAALWRSQRHTAYPWEEMRNSLGRLDPPSPEVVTMLNEARSKAEEAQKNEREETPEELYRSLSLKARLLCVTLLSSVPIAFFEASGPAAAAAALLSSPAFEVPEELAVSGLVLEILDNLGLTPKLATELVQLTKHADGQGGSTFRVVYMNLHGAIKASVRPSKGLREAIRRLKDKAHRPPDDVILSKSMVSRQPLAVLVSRLEDLARALPGPDPLGPDEDDRPRRLEKFLDAFPPLDDYETAAVKGLPPEARLAARAGAGLVHLLAKSHTSSAPASKG